MTTIDVSDADVKTPIVLPDLSAGDEQIRLVQWLVDTGDHVLEGDRVVEILVGGVLFHVAAPAEGVVQRTIESEGTPLDSHAQLGFIESESR